MNHQDFRYFIVGLTIVVVATIVAYFGNHVSDNYVRINEVQHKFTLQSYNKLGE